MRLKWSLRNIIRIPKYSVPLIVSTILTCIFITIGLGLYNMNQLVIDKVNHSFTTIVCYDRKNIITDLGEYILNERIIDLEAVEQLSRLSQVETYNYNRLGQNNYPVHLINNDILGKIEASGIYVSDDITMNIPVYVNGTRSVEMLYRNENTGVENTIILGRDFSREENDEAARVIIVNEELASALNLGVGDNFTIEKLSSYNDESIEGSTFHIVGIYKNLDGYEQDMYRCYIPGLTHHDLEKQMEVAQHDLSLSLAQVEYQLKSANLASDFIREAKGLYDNEYFTLVAEDYEYKNTIATMDMLNLISQALIYISIPAGLCLLLLQVIHSLRYKKREIGILRSMGSKKSFVLHVVIQEYFIIFTTSTFMGIVIGIGGIQYISKKIYQGVMYLVGRMPLWNGGEYGLKDIISMNAIVLVILMVTSIVIISIYIRKKPLEMIRSL